MCDRFGLERVRFTNSGTEANLMAISLARVFTRRPKVMVIEGGYHGAVFTFSAGGSPLNVPFDFVLAPYNDTAATVALIDLHAAELAAVVLEPMMGGGGCIQAEPAFLHALRAATERVGALLVFDEVMTAAACRSVLSAGGPISSTCSTRGGPMRCRMPGRSTTTC